MTTLKSLLPRDCAQVLYFYGYDWNEEITYESALQWLNERMPCGIELVIQRVEDSEPWECVFLTKENPNSTVIHTSYSLKWLFRDLLIVLFIFSETQELFPDSIDGGYQQDILPEHSEIVSKVSDLIRTTFRRVDIRLDNTIIYNATEAQLRAGLLLRAQGAIDDMEICEWMPYLTMLEKHCVAHVVGVDDCGRLLENLYSNFLDLNGSLSLELIRQNRNK